MLPGLRSFPTLVVSLRQCQHAQCLPEVNAEHWGVLRGDSGVTGRCIQILCAEPTREGGQRPLCSVVLLRRKKDHAGPPQELSAQGWSVYSR